MFDNIGGKIKVLAVIIAIFGCVVSIVGGFVLIGEKMGLIGVSVLLVGPLLSWVSNFVLYGLGELIEANNEMKAVLYKILMIAKNRNLDEKKDEHQIRRDSLDNAPQNPSVTAERRNMGKVTESVENPVKLTESADLKNSGDVSSQIFSKEESSQNKNIPVKATIKDGGELIICPSCGLEQKADRSRCFKCGQVFERR